MGQKSEYKKNRKSLCVQDLWASRRIGHRIPIVAVRKTTTARPWRFRGQNPRFGQQELRQLRPITLVTWSAPQYYARYADCARYISSVYMYQRPHRLQIGG
jgi:hypothetical protein